MSIICPICQKVCKNLASHATKAHKVSKQYLSETYGITVFMDQELLETQKANLAKGRETTWSNPELRAKCLASVNGFESKSKAAKTKWEDEAYRETMRQAASKVGKKYGSSESNIARLKELNRLNNSNEELVARRSEKQSESLKKFWSDPSKVKESGIGFRFKWIPTDTKSGHFIFRSGYEVTLAKILDKLDETFEYESLSVPYELNGITHTYHPDFFLRSRNLILEVKYSGYVDSDVNQAKKLASELIYNFEFITDKELYESEDALKLISDIIARYN